MLSTKYLNYSLITAQKHANIKICIILLYIYIYNRNPRYITHRTMRVAFFLLVAFLLYIIMQLLFFFLGIFIYSYFFLFSLSNHIQTHSLFFYFLLKFFPLLRNLFSLSITRSFPPFFFNHSYFFYAF